MNPSLLSKLDLLLSRYADWRAAYTGESAAIALQEVRKCVEAALPGAGNDTNCWAVAVARSPCSEWTAKAPDACWDPLEQDLAAYLKDHPLAELALVPNTASADRLKQFLA